MSMFKINSHPPYIDQWNYEKHIDSYAYDREYKAKQIQEQMYRLQKEYDYLMQIAPVPVPTRLELERSEALRNAYNEMLTVWKLVGVMK